MVYVAMHLMCSFYSPADPRDLHSFPTRRSSDLTLPGGQTTDARLPAQPGSPDTLALQVGFTALAIPGPASQLRFSVPPSRSEEHTSELQSRFDLVCRLLLEKKKTSSPHQT